MRVGVGWGIWGWVGILLGLDGERSRDTMIFNILADGRQEGSGEEAEARLARRRKPRDAQSKILMKMLWKMPRLEVCFGNQAFPGNIHKDYGRENGRLDS